MSEIRVDLVADASKFEAAMKRADKAAGNFEDSTKGVGDRLEKTQTQARGAADLFDGLATTMGLNVGGSIEMARGVADLADGINTTLIPALKASTAAAMASTRAFLATPWGRIAAGIALVGAATVAATNDTVNWGNIWEKTTNQISKHVTDQVNLAGKAFSWLDDKIGNNGSQLLGWAGILKTAGFTANQLQKDIADLMAQINAANASESGWQQGVGAMGEFVDHGSFTDLANEIQADSERASRVAESAAKKFAAAGKKASNEAAAAHAKAIREAAERVQKAYQAVLPKLQAAVEKANDSKQLRDRVRSLFSLDFGDDTGHNVTESLRRQVARFQEFTKKIASLRKMGLNESLVRQFVDAGPGSLDELNRIDSGNLKTINDMAKTAEKSRDKFSSAEAERRTGVNPNKPVVVTINSNDKDLKDLLKKWVKTDGGGNVQLALGSK